MYKRQALVSAMPTATMGGVSMVLYGMISAVGVRNVVENQVDFTNSRNVIIAAIIMVCLLYTSIIQAHNRKSREGDKLARRANIRPRKDQEKG